MLFGEYSGLHNNLKKGLCKLGHDVTLASGGDGWKKLDTDIFLGAEGRSLVSKIKRRLKLFHFLFFLRDYDVVQIINANLLSEKFFPNKLILSRLKRNNKKVFLLAAGDDAYFWKYGKRLLKYGPFLDTLKYDLNSDKSPLESKKFLKLNHYIAEHVDGVIPIMHEYKVSYGRCSKLRPLIPIPIDVEAIAYQEAERNDGITVFHGLNRAGTKGTHHVRKAFSVLEKKYPNVTFTIKGNMAYTEYLEVMKKTHIIVDQTNSHSLGVNGLLGMAMGKVVLGGAEPESFELYNVSEMPVINILPNSEDIVKKISSLLDRGFNEIVEMGKASSEFVRCYHDFEAIAQNYVSEWSRE